MKLIGIYGFARSGKNTVGDHLVHHHNFEDGAFADALKQAAAIAFNIPLNHFYDDEFKEVVNEFWGFSPRYIAQVFGTECMRTNFREDFWIHRLKSTIDVCRRAGKKSGFAVTDMRFSNEIDHMRDDGAILIKVTRPGVEGLVGAHASETLFPDELFDHVIANDGTLEELYAKVDKIMTL